MSFELVFCGILLLAAFLYTLMILAITTGASKKHNSGSGMRNAGKFYPKARSGPGIPSNQKISVILPVRNEVSNIVRCLDDLSMQDFPKDLFEIIVSDDFSEDYTVEKVRKWSKEHPDLRLTLLEGSQNLKTSHGKKRAIERAVDIASGDIIITTDADTVRGRCWIKKIAEEFGHKEVKMILGPVGFTSEKGMFQKVQVLEFLGIMGVTAGSARFGCSLMCNGANLAYRKEAFREAGGFSGTGEFRSGDDQFLMMKFRKHYGGRAVVFLKDKEAIVFTPPCTGWNDFWEQRLRWVSKSRGYRDAWVITAGLITIGFPLLILIGGVVGIFYPWILLLSSLLWFLKILAEYPLVWMMAGFFGKKHLLNYYFAAQVFQFFYSITAAVAGQFSLYSWKGRRFRK